MQLSCPMEAWKKEWAVHLKMFPHPSRPHFSDDPSIQPTSHYSGNTKINSMGASCPPLPQCSGSHTGLLEWEPARAWLTTDVPLFPHATLSQGLLSRAYCYYKRFYWAPQNVLDAERKTHASLTVGLRETDSELCRDDHLFYGVGQRRKSRQLCGGQCQGVGTAEAITVSDFEVLARLESSLKMT